MLFRKLAEAILPGRTGFYTARGHPNSPPRGLCFRAPHGCRCQLQHDQHPGAQLLGPLLFLLPTEPDGRRHGPTS